MQPVVILDNRQLELTVNRLCYELIENHDDFSKSVIIGLQPRGIFLANRIANVLTKKFRIDSLKTGKLDITFYRDDFRRKVNPLTASSTAIDFIIENKNVILIDDVLYTGRTIRAGLDAMLAFGRPARVELLVLIDRRFSRHLPVQPDYTGRTVDSISSERVSVEWKETEKKDQVLLYNTSKTDE